MRREMFGDCGLQNRQLGDGQHEVQFVVESDESDTTIDIQ
jgi:hypothetical protein